MNKKSLTRVTAALFALTLGGFSIAACGSDASTDDGVGSDLGDDVEAPESDLGEEDTDAEADTEETE